MSKLALLGGKKVRGKPFTAGAVIGEEEKARVRAVLERGILSGFIAQAGDNFLGGACVKDLESVVKDYFKARHAIAVNSATAGLHAAVSACRIGAGDEVIVPPYTMTATATAIVMQNAVPVFVDIEEDTFCLDPEKIERRVTKRTKAIMAVHLFGRPARMDEIMAIAKKYNLKVIEDCAQSPGAAYKGNFAGRIGDAGIFSLNQHKTITCGEGGFALTDSDELAMRMQLVRNHGEAVVAKMGIGMADDIIGYNYRMTELEAAVAIGQINRLDFLNDHRIGPACYLTENLSALDGLTLPAKEAGRKNVYFAYPMKVDESKLGVPRELFVRAIQAEGIPFGAGYTKPIYLEPLYKKKISCPKGACPVAERMYEKELILTSLCRYPHTKEDMRDICDAFFKIYDNIDNLRHYKP